jgi:hypothetical protein
MRFSDACRNHVASSCAVQTTRQQRPGNTATPAYKQSGVGSRYLLCWLLSSVLLPALAASIPPATYEAIYAELHQPIQVCLTNGRTISGHSIEVSENQIRIATAKGAGNATHTFDSRDIHTYTLPGDSYKALAVEWMESGATDNAHELMHMLYLQRVRILPFLPPAESHFFIYYVDLTLAAGMPARAIAIAETLQPQIQNPAARHALEDTILDSYNRLQLYDAARPLAQAWVTNRQPYGQSALGYYVLGADKLRSADYHAALELALQPIVFSPPSTPDNLAHCYATAISAALGLRDNAYALTLYSEMQQRSLHWPSDDPSFTEPFKKLRQHLVKRQNQRTLNEQRASPPSPHP